MDYVDLTLAGSEVFSLATTSRIILPALGSGRIIRPTQIEAWYLFGGAPFNYVAVPFLIISPSPAIPAPRLRWGALDLNMINRLVNSYNTTNLTINPTSGVDTISLDNQPLYISLSNNIVPTLTTNSSLKVRLSYLTSSSH